MSDLRIEAFIPPKISTAGRSRHERAQETKKPRQRLVFFRCISFWYTMVVPVVGLEPTRCRQQRILSPPRLPIPTHRLIPEDCSMKFGVLQFNFILYVGLPAYFARFLIAAAIEGQTPAYYAYELRISRLHRIAASHKLTQELRITIVPYGGYHSTYASLYAGRTHAIALSYLSLIHI